MNLSLKLLFPDPNQRSPTAVSNGSWLCACCEKDVRGGADTYVLLNRNTRLEYCDECSAYLQVVLPMVKLVREKSMKGEII